MSFKSYRETLFSKLGYTPTKAQKPIFESEAKRILVAGGWRGGKSDTGGKIGTLYSTISSLIWLVGPTYDTPRNNEFKYITEDAQKLGILKEMSKPQQGSCKATLHNGCEIVTKSANDPFQLQTDAPDLIIGCEAAKLTYEDYLALKGRALEKSAPIILTGTFEDFTGWYNDYYNLGQFPNDEGIVSYSLPTWSNEIMFPPGEYQIRLANGDVVNNVNESIYKEWTTTAPDYFLQRYGGVPCKPSNAILPEFSNAIHVKECSYDPSCPVEIAVDPGSGVPGAYAVEAIQYREGAIYIISEQYLQGRITEEIIAACKQDWPWFWEIKTGGLDIAGTQKHGMPPVAKAWRDLASIHLLSHYVEVKRGIEILRSFLAIHPETGRPKIYVDPKCKGFISECGGCKSPVRGGGIWLRDEKTGKPSDDNCHATKAVIYWIVSRLGYTPGQQSNYGQVYTLNDSGRMVAVERR